MVAFVSTLIMYKKNDFTVEVKLSLKIVETDDNEVKIFSPQ
jgi:hypothetical protein